MPVVKSVTDEWVDIFAASGFPVGTALRIQNQGNGRLVCTDESATTPTGPKDDGRWIQAWKEAQVDADAVGCFAWCPGGVRAFVQEWK